LRAKYRQSILGYVWAFLPPLAVTLTFVFLQNQGILRLSAAAPAVPYPVYVFVGTLLWQAFVDALNAPLKLVTNARNLLIKINFPREALLLAGLGEVLLNLGIRLLLAAGVLVFFQVPLPATLALAPIGMLCLICLGLMVGVLLTPLGVLYKDIRESLVIIISMWFFLTPVVYSPPGGQVGKLLSLVNPVTPLLVTTRTWMLTGPAADVGLFFTVSAVVVGLLLVGWLFYRIAMPHLVERMGA
jgi:lipopolysaccharide transport system permease protein